MWPLDSLNIVSMKFVKNELRKEWTMKKMSYEVNEYVRNEYVENELWGGWADKRMSFVRMRFWPSAQDGLTGPIRWNSCFLFWSKLQDNEYFFNQDQHGLLTKDSFQSDNPVHISYWSSLKLFIEFKLVSTLISHICSKFSEWTSTQVWPQEPKASFNYWVLWSFDEHFLK